MDKLNKQKGFSTIEILIALALSALTVTAVTSVVFGSQSVAVDSQTNTEALHIAQENLESALATSRENYNNVVADLVGTPYLNGSATLDVPVSFLTACRKQVVSRVNWIGESNRSQTIELATNVTNVPLMLALGGVCDTTPPSGGWNPPATYTCGRFNTGDPTAVDVLNRIVYMTAEVAPYIYITDSNGAVFNPLCHNAQNVQFVAFANGFDDGAQLNDIKVARASNGNVYAYVARDTSTNQFEVIDVNDINNPTSVIKRSLAGVGGSNPEGWKVYYYDGKAYIVARYTAGPEFHVFDVSTPWIPGSIQEIGSGTELGFTVEDFVVTKKTISGSPHYIAYMASDGDSNELLVVDITNVPGSIISTPAGDLLGIQNGASLYLLNDLLYFGRDSTPPGSDLYVFNVQDPQNITIRGQQDINTGVIGIAVTGDFAFLGTPKVSKEFQAWTSNPDSITLISPFNFPNVISGHGVRYEDNWVYLASSSNDSLRILYSP